MLLFSPLFSGNFCKGRQGCGGGVQNGDRGGSPSPPIRENPAAFHCWSSLLTLYFMGMSQSNALINQLLGQLQLFEYGPHFVWSKLQSYGANIFQHWLCNRLISAYYFTKYMITYFKNPLKGPGTDVAAIKIFCNIMLYLIFDFFQTGSFLH